VILYIVKSEEGSLEAADVEKVAKVGEDGHPLNDAKITLAY
jgi:hypothetical protein